MSHGIITLMRFCDIVLHFQRRERFGLRAVWYAQPQAVVV
jgi:hypothetical protein